MGGGIIQLAATGISDLYITGDPQITWFKVVYRRYSEFSMVDYPIKINGDPQPGDVHMINIPPIADKLNRLCLVVDVPQPVVEAKLPIVANIKEITDKHDLNLIFDPPKKSTDTVTYDDLFNTDPTSIGTQMTDKTKSLDKEYDLLLDVLDYISSTYSVSNDRYLGNHIALEASGIDFQAFGDYIDFQGYVLLTPEKTRDLILSTNKIIDLYEDSFMYYPETSTNSIAFMSKRYHDFAPTEINEQDIGIQDIGTHDINPRDIDPADLSTPIDGSAPVMGPRFPTIDKMMKVYPRFVNGYTQLSSVQDLDNIIDADNTRYHIMISIDFLRKVQKRNTYIRRVYLNSLDIPGATTDTVNEYLEQVKDTNLSSTTQQSIIFNNFNYNELFTDGSYETGIYLFETDPSIPLDDAYQYQVALMNVLDTGSLEIPVNFVDTVTYTDPETYVTTEVFNRYNINENAIYDSTWELADNPLDPDQVTDVDAEVRYGFFMLNLDEMDNDPANQHVIDLLSSGSGLTSETTLRFNPRFLHCNTRRIGFAPHTIKKVWEHSIVKNVLVKDPLVTDPPNFSNIVEKQFKVENLLDGVTTIVKLFGDIYTIPGIVNAPQFSQFVSGTVLNVPSIQYLHSLLIAMQEDILNDQTQIRNYGIQDIKLYNSITIKKVIDDKLIKDIIYVDQRKMGYGVDKHLAMYIRKMVIDTETETKTTDEYDYLDTEDGYIHDPDPLSPSPDAMAHNRNLVYELSKYIMWTYYLENIYPRYDIALDNKLAVSEFMSKLSYMLIQVPKNPVGIDPNDVSGTGIDDLTTKNVRYASHDVNDITKCYIYDDQSIIESYDVLHKASTQELATSVYDYQYIYASERYGETPEPDDQTYPLSNGVTTCINREVEFYHVVSSFRHDDISTNNTIYDYFMGLIVAAYTDNRNYMGTISFKTTQQYLSDYFSNINVFDSSVSMSKINSEISGLMIKAVNLTLINYIKLVFGVWKNSTYTDIESTPQYSSYAKVGNEISTSNIDYNANYVLNYLRQLALDQVITQPEVDNLGDPALMRTRQYVGGNVSYRPSMGFSYEFQIDYASQSTYTKETQMIVNTSDFVNKTDSLVQGSDFKDIFANQIDIQVSNVKYNIEQLARNNPLVRNNMQYIFWRDLNTYMRYVVDDLNTDLQTPDADHLTYYFNTMVLNHLPIVMTYYYGQYLQYAMRTQYVSGVFNEEENVILNINYDTIPIEEEDDNIARRFDVEPDDAFDFDLKYLGTDVRINPRCPFHNHISLYSDVSTMDENCFKYLLSNDISFVQDMCPICFRTFEFKRLFNLLLYRTLLRPNVSPPQFVDDPAINTLRPNGVNLTPEAMPNPNIVYPDYTIFLYRPEDIIYDEVSKSYFHSIMEFTLYRIGAIMFRYKNMIQNLIDMDQGSFDGFIGSITPTGQQIGAPNPINGLDEFDRFNDFVAYLEGLRTNGGGKFSPQMDVAISIITQTYTDIVSFFRLQEIYDAQGGSPDLIAGEWTAYTAAELFIGNRVDLTSNLEIFNLIPNVIYDKTDLSLSGGNLLRYQMYSGNILLWVLIQHAIINSYNNFFTNVLEPRQINSNSTLTGQTTDLYTEIFTLFNQSVSSQYVNSNGTIDYYRYKQTREYVDTQSEVTNDLESSVCTKALNYCRQLMIFYNMLLARYKRMRFLLDTTQNTTLNSDANYFNFSQNITEGYLASAVTRIKNMEIIDINPAQNQNINDRFYYPDTSDYYFIDGTTFRNLQINESDLALTTDYQMFNTDNNYHISQTFTLNHMTSMMRILGIRDESLAPYPDAPAQNQTSAIEYHNKISQGLSIGFNDNFKQYFTVDETTNALNNFEKYLYSINVVFEPDSGFRFDYKIFRIANGGILNRLWYYYPTISNILYDQYYTPVILKSDIDYNTTQSNYYEIAHITRRTFTKCLVTSPLVYLRDKTSDAIFNEHNHTTNMTIWEDVFHANNSSVIDPSDSDTVEQSRDLEIQAMFDLFNAYQYFVGSYKFTDIISILSNFRKSTDQDIGSIGDFIIKYEAILDGIADRVSVAFNLERDRFRVLQLQMSLTIENANAVNQLSGLVVTTVGFTNQAIDNLRIINDQILEKYPDLSTGYKNIVNVAFQDIITSLNSVIAYIGSLNMTTLINNIKQDTINVFTTIDSLTDGLKQYLEPLNNLVYLDNGSLFNIIDRGIESIRSSVNFLLLDTDTDDRVYTPSVLYNLRNLTAFDSFTNYRNVLHLILTQIIKFMTPDNTLDNTIDTQQPSSSENTNFLNLAKIVDNQTRVNDAFVPTDIPDSRIDAYNLSIRNIKTSVDSVLSPMSDLTVLSRYIDTSRDKVNVYDRYDFDQIISEPTTNTNSGNYYEYKQQLIRLKSASSQSALTAYASKGIRFEMNKLRRSMGKPPIIWESDTEIKTPESKTVETYVGSAVYIQLMKVLTSSVPQHAWVRYLGYRLIEEVGLIIDGEQIDMQDGDLMLLLHKTHGTVAHERGDNIMLGHVPEMYTISSDPKPAMRLYIQFFLFFGKHYGNSLPLINMMYSDIKLKLKLRKFEDLFYIEDGGALKKPVKMKFQLLGNYIYLDDDERRICAKTKSEALMERFISSGTLTRDIKDLKTSMLTDFGKAHNVLKIKYRYDDPCKYLLWKIQVEYPDAQPSDIISWDLGNYRVRHPMNSTANQAGVIDIKSKIIEVVNRTLIEFNGKTREQWKDNTYFQILQPYNKCLKALDSGEALYAMCLFPGLLQPSGTTNLSQIEDLSFYFEINKQIADLMKRTGLKIKFTMWECSYNVFVAISGFGALRFYAVS
jgi:hypothetical protein